MSINDSNIFEIDQNNFKGSLDLLLDLAKEFIMMALSIQ